MKRSTAENIARMLDLVGEMNMLAGQLNTVGVQVKLSQNYTRDDPLAKNTGALLVLSLDTGALLG